MGWEVDVLDSHFSSTYSSNNSLYTQLSSKGGDLLFRLVAFGSTSLHENVKLRVENEDVLANCACEV